MKMEQGVPKRRHKIQAPGNHPTERLQHSEHDESLKSRVVFVVGSTSSDGLLSDDRTFLVLYIQISLVACRKLKTGLRVIVNPVVVY